jgi:CHASE2 domain-containing sensor protein
MRKTIIGVTIGFIAGLIDLIPMIIQKLTWDANISALTMWIIIGFLTTRSDLKINAIIKGILIAFLVLMPSAILIGWKEPFSLIPIAVMTIILGGLLGFTIDRLTNKKGQHTTRG